MLCLGVWDGVGVGVWVGVGVMGCDFLGYGLWVFQVWGLCAPLTRLHGTCLPSILDSGLRRHARSQQFVMSLLVYPRRDVPLRVLSGDMRLGMNEVGHGVRG